MDCLKMRYYLFPCTLLGYPYWVLYPYWGISPEWGLCESRGCSHHNLGNFDVQLGLSTHSA